jgi:hypothetical protein
MTTAESAAGSIADPKGLGDVLDHGRVLRPPVRCVMLRGSVRLIIRGSIHVC